MERMSHFQVLAIVAPRRTGFQETHTHMQTETSETKTTGAQYAHTCHKNHSEQQIHQNATISIRVPVLALEAQVIY